MVEPQSCFKRTADAAKEAQLTCLLTSSLLGSCILLANSISFTAYVPLINVSQMSNCAFCGVKQDNIVDMEAVQQSTPGR